MTDKIKHYKPLFPLKEYFKELFEYRGHFVFDDLHSVAQYNERVGKDIFLYNKLIKKGINWIIENKKEDIRENYIFRSKKYGFGIQVEWRKDNKNKIKGLHAYTSTTFSDNEMNYFTRNDKVLFLEYLWNEGYSKEESLKYIERGYIRYPFEKLEEKELKEKMDYNGFQLFIECGKIYYTFELIEL